jgi:hypothetical protein
MSDAQRMAQQLQTLHGLGFVEFTCHRRAEEEIGVGFAVRNNLK